MTDSKYRVTQGAVRMPAGTYYVGDPCYSIETQDDWMAWLRAADYENSSVLIALHKGEPVLGLGTAYGDGCYRDQHGNSYPVDAGLIGLVPVSVADKAGGRVVTFDRPFECSMNDAGTIVFGDIVIETGDAAAEDWYDDDE